MDKDSLLKLHGIIFVAKKEGSNFPVMLMTKNENPEKFIGGIKQIINSKTIEIISVTGISEEFTVSFANGNMKLKHKEVAMTLKDIEDLVSDELKMDINEIEGTPVRDYLKLWIND